MAAKQDREPNQPPDREAALPETSAFYAAAQRRLIPKILNNRDALGVRSRFLARITAPAFILDVGAGPGRDLSVFGALNGNTALGIDPVTEFVSYANAAGNGPVILGDLRRIPLPDATVDGVWMSSVLVHVPKAEAPAALTEVRRVMKTTGVLSIVTGMGDGEFWRPDAETGTTSFIAHYRAGELNALLRNAGFRVVERDTLTRAHGGGKLLARTAVAL